MTKINNDNRPKSCDQNHCDQCGKCEKPHDEVLQQVDALMEIFLVGLDQDKIC